MKKQTTLKRFIALASGVVFISLMALLFYTNFGPRQDFSIFLPLAFLKEIGVNQDVIIILRSNADKAGHFVAGLIYTVVLFFALRPFKKFNVLFSMRAGPILFLSLISLAELGQYLSRIIACDVTNTCNNFYFSVTDIFAGFAGCLIAVYSIRLIILLFNKKRGFI